MGRAFSFSLAGHVLFALCFLLLSATRQPIRLPEVVRPVRLVAYVEAPAPSAARPPRVVAAAPAPRAAPARAVPAPEPEPAAAPEPLAPLPAATPKVLVPVREAAPPKAAPPPAAPAPGLRERLARRLAAEATAGPAPAVESAAPQLASLPAEPEQPPAPRLETASLAGAATGGAGPVMPVGDFPHAWYLAVLKDRIYARWTPPSEVFSGSRASVALVSFRIDRTGGVSRAAVKQGSGSARFDQSALAAVQGLGRVPALPPQYPEEALDVVIRFQNEK